MIYNNLIYFLVVILIFSTNTIPQSPSLAPLYGLAVFLIKFLLFSRWVFDANQRGTLSSERQYFRIEQKFSILAVISFAIDVYLLDCKYYLALLALGGHLPFLVDLGGLALFCLYLGLIWAAGRRNYTNLFGRAYTPKAFLALNIRQNLPIVLPWLFLNLASDLLRLLPLPQLRRLLATQWGEPLLFLFFFLLLAISFPALIKRLWNCSSLPTGPVRDHIEDFCRRQNFAFSEIMIWPLFEGRILTAGVMGLSRRLRYLLITPALLEALSPEEMEAVIAHEIGHVKKYHLQLYLLFFLGFGIMVSMIANPILYLLLSSDTFYRLLSLSGTEPGTAIAFWWTLPLFFFMIIYFRFIFGFFMRNFERQADLHVFKALGDSRQLVNSLEKIAWLSGNIRDQPSWHHFGIGQRVDYLQKCKTDPSQIKKHDRKVNASLAAYLLLSVAAITLLANVPLDRLDTKAKNKFVETVLVQKIRQEPQNGLWFKLLGDFKVELKAEAEAIEYYSKALALIPDDPELLNNLAWMLVTAASADLHDPLKALSLALSAAARKPDSHILDTLAEVYWANGMTEKAAAAEKQALALDPENRDYYRQQLEKFRTRTWPSD